MEEEEKDENNNNRVNKDDEVDKDVKDDNTRGIRLCLFIFK